MATNLRSRKCLQCGNSMPVTMRADAKFCGYSCRDKNRNQTQSRGVELQGSPVGRAQTDSYLDNPTDTKLVSGKRRKAICGLCGELTKVDYVGFLVPVYHEECPPLPPLESMPKRVFGSLELPARQG